MDMTDRTPHLDLNPIIARFPTAARAIRRLALSDPAFRSICEDHSLASATLERFRQLSEHSERPEVAEYRGLVEGLQDEIRRYLEDRSEHGPGSGWSD